MPDKLKKRIPTYRLHKASGRAVVTLPGSVLKRGRDVFLGCYGTPESRQRYAQVIAEWTATGDVRPAPTSDITVIELVDRYWVHVRSYYVKDSRPTSEQDLIKQALAPLLKLYGLTPAREFGPLALKTVRQTMVGKQWCRNYINRQCSRVRMVFGWAVENELVPSAVFHGLQAVKGLRKGRSEVLESEPVRPVAAADIAAVQQLVPAAVCAMIQLQLRTGARPGEICIMRTADIETTGKVWLYRPHSHKTEHHEHERIIHIGPRAQTILRPWLQANLSAYVFSPADEAAAKMKGDCSRRGLALEDRKRSPQDRYSVASYRRAIARACDRAFPHPDPVLRPALIDLGEGKSRVETRAEFNARMTDKQSDALKKWQSARRWHPHQLRHNAATALRKAGTVGNSPPNWMPRAQYSNDRANRFRLFPSYHVCGASILRTEEERQWREACPYCNVQF
ncbi:MAG: tyrosine-type recombinase/integrase [Phycisphaerales bacterium]|nr:tyrosine-type recombinase/integrase [Phycisphaerales bacterium]MCI0629242.1 tyrosine-type recombinase/integrase [Phycisphaerales bacterium]MCI0675877.1 tyrosine-type recombinase/integrase [Phycisphaerales bacterium]